MEVKSNVDKILREFDKKMKQAVEVIGGIAESAAKDLAPKDTGLLANSIAHGAAGGKLSATSYASNSGEIGGEYADANIPEDAGGAKYVVVVGTNVQYAVYQELGTSRMEAHAFLRPAIENNKETYKNVVEQLLKG